MKKGDIVKVRHGKSPDHVKIGIVINAPRKMYMVGYVANIMIDGQIERVKEEHIQSIDRGEKAR